jgi:MFS family permease
VVGFATLAAGTSFYLFSAALPLYLNRHLGYSVQAVGVMVALTAIAQIVATLGSGPVIDRLGARFGLRVGIACYLLAATLLIASSAYLPIAAARILQGIGLSLVLPSVFSIVPAFVPKGRQGTAIGLVGAFNNLGLAIGPPLGIALLSASPFVLFGAALLAAGAAIAASVLLRVGLPAAEPGQLLKYRMEWTPLYAITFLCVVYWGVVTAFLAIEVPASQVPNVGWFFAADALAVMAARIPAGSLADRFGSRWLLLAGVVTTGVAISLLFLTPSFLTLVVAGIGTGVGAALLLPPILLELTRRSDERDRGTAMALYNTSFAAAVAVGSLGGAVLVQAFGFQATLLASFVSCLAAAPVALAFVRPIENAEPSGGW